MSQPQNDATQRGAPRLTESEYHELLRPERRRIAFDTLTERIAPVDLENLVIAVATRESSVKAADEEFVERVKISLHHNHLPKMADLGVVEYDPDATRIDSCPPYPNA